MGGQENDLLNKIVIKDWVLGTISRALKASGEDPTTWSRCWREEYSALGGKSKSVGRKSCTRAAARALWLLGRIKGGKRKPRDWSVSQVIKEFGINAAYAEIAIKLLSKRVNAAANELWPEIQNEFEATTGIEPAQSEQGEIRLVVGLHRAKLLV